MASLREVSLSNIISRFFGLVIATYNIFNSAQRSLKFDKSNVLNEGLILNFLTKTLLLYFKVIILQSFDYSDY